MNRFSAFALTFALTVSAASTALADTVVVAPNANTTVAGGGSQYALFGEGSTAETFQWDLAASQLTALVGKNINAIGFRLSADSSVPPPNTVIGGFNLQLSSSLNPIGSLNSNANLNIGPNAVSVYSGSLTLGTLVGGNSVNPFFTINFANPFLYTGGDLLSTLAVSNGSIFGVDGFLVGPLGDTSSNLSGSGRSEYYNVPVTEFISRDSVPPTNVTPEPSSLMLLMTGAGAIATQVRRRFKRAS